MKQNRIIAGAAVFFTAILIAPSVVWAGGQAEEIAVPETASELKDQTIDGIADESVVKKTTPQGGEMLRLTEEEAVEIALANNLQLKSEEINVRIKERTADYAWNRFIPSVQASGTLGRMNTEQSYSGLIGAGTETAIPGVGTQYTDVLEISQDVSQWSVSAGLDMSLTLNMAMFDGIRATRIDYQAGRISYKQAEQRVIRDVKKSFYNLLLMKENRELMVENIDAAERRYEQARINYENGMVPELTVLSAQVAWENLKPQLKAIDLGYRQALQGFKMTLGVDLDREVELEGSFEAEAVEVDADELIETRLTDRLDVQSMMTTIAALENQLRATKLQVYTPQLILGFNMDPSFGGDPWADPWFGGDYEWSQRSGMFRATLAMSLDAFLPFSQAQIGMRELEDSIQQTRIGMLQMIEGAKLEIDATVQQLEKSRDTIDTLQLNVQRAERAYEMAEEAYNAGSKELLEVQNSEIELKTAKLEVLKEKYNYLTALIDLEYQLNTTIEELTGE